MPGFDGTGPGGQGPMTGRRMGRCVPAQVQGESDANSGAQAAQGQVYGLGRGGQPYGCGRGFGGGRRRRCFR